MTLVKWIMVPVLLLAWAADGVIGQTPKVPQGSPGQPRERLGSLKRAIEQAGAAVLTAQQETDLNALIASFRETLPTEPDEALKAAHDAYADALLAGDIAAAQAQATIIANRQAQLSATRLTAEAKFVVSAFAILKSGGQLDALVRQFDDRVVGLVRSLAGPGGPRGGPGGGPGGPGGGPRPFPSGQ